MQVLDQSEPSTDGDCISSAARAHYGRGAIRVHHMHWSQAKGPCWARAMLQQCLHDEEYYLQVRLARPRWATERVLSVCVCVRGCGRLILTCGS